MIRMTPQIYLAEYTSACTVCVSICAFICASYLDLSASMETAKWLKSRYMVGLPTKKVKFSKIHDELATHFTGIKFKSLAVSQAIKEAFPESKPCGKANHWVFFGLQEHESIHKP